MIKKAVFFDKDGVLTVDKGVLENITSIELIPHSADILAHYSRLGYKIFVITNQPIVARGLINEKELHNHLQQFRNLVLHKNINAKIDKIVFCPHHPNADVQEYRILCDCRKPKPGMIKQLASEFEIDLSQSFVIGDRISDVIAGHLAGCTTVLFQSGAHNEKMIETDLIFDKPIRPDFIISAISELKDIIK